MARLRLSVSRCAPVSACSGAVAAALCAGAPAHAHGFGQRYELPLPLDLYVFGAAAVVALSFAVFSLLVRRAPASRPQRRFDLLAGPIGRIIGSPAVIMALRLAVLALLLIAIAAGLFGDPNPYRNIAPTLVWIVFWVGVAYVSAFVGDIWALVNPWRTIFDGAEWLMRRLGRGAPELNTPYLEALGVWPAALLLFAFAWTELIDPNAGSPRHIANLIIAYSTLTLAGMFVFGRDVWLRHGEVFSVVFGTLARFAPTEARGGSLYLRPYGAGLIEGEPVSTSMVAFVLLLLATVLYDGLIGTGEWALLEDALRGHIPGIGTAALRTAGLLVFWLIFLAAYLGICAAMSALAAGDPPPLAVARHFVLTLVPIAIGYDVAHYFVFLLVQGQYLIPLLSDPLGRGWDLFGTAGYRVDVALAGARFSWYLALGAIVAGHVFSVYLAHRRAIDVFAHARLALTQTPLTALMVVYTFVGLSIVAQPIVESGLAREPAATATGTVAIPTDAVLPDAQSGELRPVGAGGSARLRLAYKVLGSAFHDGGKTGAADLLYAYAFAYRWGEPANRERGDYDPDVDAATALLRRHLLAVRVGGVDAASRSFRVGDVDFVREVLSVEVYLSAAPEEPEWSALIAPPFSTVPWTLLVLMEEAVTRGLTAFSESEARRRGVPWLDLARSPELNARLAALVTQFEREAFRPKALHALVAEGEARRRWAALAAFHKTHGHFLVTNGPYKLKDFTAQSATLEAFRDLTYPLGVGSYDAYAVPRRGFITRLDWNGERLTAGGDIEVVEKFQRSYRLVRTPLKSIPAAIRSRATPECRTIITDAQGRVVFSGTAAAGSDGDFAINLKSRLPAGRYTVSAMLVANGNAMNAEIRRIAIEIDQR